MDRTKFEQELAREGYSATESVLKASPPKKPHTHEFDAHILVLDGEITIAREDGETTYGKGDVYRVPAGTVHTEIVRSPGVTLLAGTRAPA